MRTTEIGACTPPSGTTPGDPSAGSDDDLAADLLTQDPVRRADVAGLLRRDRRGLQAVPVLLHCDCGLVHDTVLRRPPRLEREIEARELELDSDHVRGEHAQCLFEKLLTGLVAFEHDDRLHVAILLAAHVSDRD